MNRFVFLSSVVMTIVLVAAAKFVNASAGSPATAPIPCDWLRAHDNCYINSTCADYNGMCLPDCTAYNPAGDCATWPHCIELQQGYCAANCSAITNRDRCMATTESCMWYQGLCRRRCDFYFSGTDCYYNAPHCWWSVTETDVSCMPHCDVAVDEFTCSTVMGTGCGWDNAARKCLVTCRHLSSKSSCEGYPHCWWGNTTCGVRCGWAKTEQDCTVSSTLYTDNGACTWIDGMTCVPSCSVLEVANCSMNPICAVGPSTQTWQAGQLICRVNDCTRVGMACAQPQLAGYCDWINGTICRASCSDNVSTCPTDICTYDATSSMCTSNPCWATTVPGECNGRVECAWVTDQCQPKCAQAPDEPTCLQWPFCSYWAPDVNGGTCMPKCNTSTTQDDCDAASTDASCFWSASNTCITACRLFAHDNASCWGSGSCWMLNTTAAQLCLPKCSIATTAAWCNSTFFQDNLGCVWNSWTQMCVAGCQYTSAQNCAYPCSWNTNFSLCVGVPPPPTTTTTSGVAAPTTTQGTAGATTTTVSGAAGPTTTAAQPAGPTTTMMTTTGGATSPTTTAASGAPATTSTGQTGGATTTTARAAGPTTSTTAGANSPTTTAAGPSPPATTSANGGSTTNAPGGSTTQATGPTATGTTVTTVSGAPMATTSAPPSPPATTAAPTYQVVLTLFANNTNSQAQILQQLSSLIGYPTTQMSVISNAGGNLEIEFDDPTNGATSAVSAATAKQRALALTQSQLGSLGAAQIGTAAPAAAPSSLNLGAVVGGAVGGAIVLVIILVLLKRSSSGGSGARYLPDDRVTEEPMLKAPVRSGGGPAPTNLAQLAPIDTGLL